MYSTKYRDLLITVDSITYDTAPWDTENIRPHLTLRLEKHGKACRVDYWYSVCKDFQPSQEDLLEAAECILREAQCGAMSLKEFKSEFGSIESYRECKSLYKHKVSSLFCPVELEDYIETLQEVCY